MARLSACSLALLALLCCTVVVSSFTVDDDYMYKMMYKRGGRPAIDGKNFPMSFGKRAANPAALAGLDRMAYRMNFGKRSAGPVEIEDSDEKFEEAKRMDKTAFRVGFGRR